MSTQIWENDQTSNQQKIQVAMFVEKFASLNEDLFHRYSWLSLPKGTPKLGISHGDRMFQPPTFSKRNNILGRSDPRRYKMPGNMNHLPSLKLTVRP